MMKNIDKLAYNLSILHNTLGRKKMIFWTTYRITRNYRLN